MKVRFDLFRKLGAAVLVPVCVLTGPAQPAAAVTIAMVDQQQTVHNGSNSSGGGGLLSRKTQTFVPTFSGLDAVEFMLFGSAQDEFQVNIRENGPFGTIIGTSLASTLPVLGTTIVSFDFPTVVPLTPGNLYAMEIVPLVLNSGGFSVRLSLTDVYPVGDYFTEGNISFTADAWFREGLQAAPAVPEPTGIILAAMGLVGVISRASRRGRDAAANTEQVQ